jgi:hypothetical protein
MPQPSLFHGPVLPDLVKAGGGGSVLGSIGGFFAGSVYSAFGKVNLLKCAGYGAGVLGNFGVWLVVASRIWS